MVSVKIDSRWIGLQGPTSLIWWIQNELAATAGHQQHPDPAEGAMGQGSLGRCELDQAEHEGRHRREGMQRDRGSGIEQRREAHEEFDSIRRPACEPRSPNVNRVFDINRRRMSNRSSPARQLHRSRAGHSSRMPAAAAQPIAGPGSAWPTARSRRLRTECRRPCRCCARRRRLRPRGAGRARTDRWSRNRRPNHRGRNCRHRRRCGRRAWSAPS